MNLQVAKYADTPVSESYNGQVYLVPTSNWQLAIRAAVISTRLVFSDQHESASDPRAFECFYSARNYSPVIWYTPRGGLSDEVYDFLHRLPGIRSVVVLSEDPANGLPELDIKNLEAILDEFNARRQNRLTERTPRLYQYALVEGKGRHGKEIASSSTAEKGSPFTSIKLWLNLHNRLTECAPTELPIRLPRIAIVTPTSPYFACAVVPLAAYVQATLLFTDSAQMAEDDLNSLVDAILESPGLDEVWLIGPTQSLRKQLRDAINVKRKISKRFDLNPAIRIIPGQDHFIVSEQAAVMLRAYRCLDWMLKQSITRSEGRDFFFDFLASPSMQTLHYYCNRVLDMAEQLRRKNFHAIMDVHDVYWSMDDDERRNFVQQFQKHFKEQDLVRQNLAVVADYVSDELNPHHIIDAAAFGARRAAPLLLLQPLPTETSYYIGSLMDKIDDRLNVLTLRQVEKVKLDTQRYSPALDLVPSSPYGNTDDVLKPLEPEATQYRQQWKTLKNRIKSLNEEVNRLKMELNQSVHKTGEVLYESLVPLTVRKTLHQLQPKFLAAFIQDPSLPIELVCETENRNELFTEAANLGERGGESGLNGVPLEGQLGRFWSLCYAIGHISSVNFYETNLTSNISFFTPRVPGGGKIRVLLCSNPTRDLFFSTQEAMKIAKFFCGEKLKIGGELVELNFESKVVLLAANEPGAEAPTRENLIAEFRQGHDIVHYSGHAFFDNVLPGRSGLLLSNGVLTASDVRFMLSLNRNPIIYANACSAGRIKSISSRFTGLAAAFIRAGAVGYISPLWSIDDQEAAAMAAEYYRALLLERKSIGECLQQAKKEQARVGSITWASLVLYGDPSLSILAMDGPNETGSSEVNQ